MKIGVVGLWHLGCVISASWLKIGHEVVGIDFNEEAIQKLSQGKAPLFEPGLEETFEGGFKNGKLQFSTDPSLVKDCDFVFLAYDTPVDENDQCDLKTLEYALAQIGPHLKAPLVVSSQVPVGTCRRWRQAIEGLEIIYSPENLRLGEAIQNYMNPGHIVIGADTEKGIQLGKSLFSAIPARYLTMSLPSAEMTKHAINSFLATSVTFANQLSDVCQIVGADYLQVVAAIKEDPRIGKRAFLKAGIGFSGGTLGRDLKVLDAYQATPFFGEIWNFNKIRPKLIVDRIRTSLGELQGKTIALLGMTYKPGTSTLRRSIPLEIAHLLVNQGAAVKVYDPKANWAEADLGAAQVTDSPYRLTEKADLLILLTEWEEFKTIDFIQIAKEMKTRAIFDPHRFWDDRYLALQSIGFKIFV
ncbi:MAG: UDP-glucose/GDP-mannose dehydrogenase family protein [Verrucomicrobia bacterium]|nr:UDP-glucose/GDP-mannose dehydrogenase family protein [Verrucomicrobiota bacterium]